jgi:regulatory protein YycI of two-component signal transduction system YycFG
MNNLDNTNRHMSNESDVTKYYILQQKEAQLVNYRDQDREISSAEQSGRVVLLVCA